MVGVDGLKLKGEKDEEMEGDEESVWSVKKRKDGAKKIPAWKVALTHRLPPRWGAYCISCKPHYTSSTVQKKVVLLPDPAVIYELQGRAVITVVGSPLSRSFWASVSTSCSKGQANGRLALNAAI